MCWLRKGSHNKRIPGNEWRRYCIYLFVCILFFSRRCRLTPRPLFAPFTRETKKAEFEAQRKAAKSSELPRTTIQSSSDSIVLYDIQYDSFNPTDSFKPRHKPAKSTPLHIIIMSSSGTQVNDANGNRLTLIPSGETVARALERIRSPGILEDSNGIALLDTDLITAEGAPYVFKAQQPQQQQQQYGKLRCCFLIHCAGRTSIRV